MSGVSVAIHSQDSRLIEQLRRDFSYFLMPAAGPTPAQILVTCHRDMLPKASWPSLLASSVSNRCVTFNQDHIRWINYYRGRAVVRWDMTKEEGDFWCSEAELSHELLYLLILSRTGAILDRRGLHRLHACGVAYSGRAILAVGPSGSGKTTLALDAITNCNADLISDDMPIIDRSGLITAWPSRVGVVSRPAHKDLDSFIRPFHRSEHGLKWIIDIQAFDASIAAQTKPGRIVVMRRKFVGEPRVRRISRWQAFNALIGPLVFGLGIPQLVEYFLRYTWRDWLAKIPLVGSRLIAAAALSWKSEGYEFEVNDDCESTLAIWRLFLKDAELEYSKFEMQKRSKTHPLAVLEN